jgi:hypothetical protein
VNQGLSHLINKFKGFLFLNVFPFCVGCFGQLRGTGETWVGESSALSASGLSEAEFEGDILKGVFPRKRE